MNTEEAIAIFEKWPEIEEFYLTSDNKPFLRFSEAKPHSLVLSDKNILVVERYGVIELAEKHGNKYTLRS